MEKKRAVEMVERGRGVSVCMDCMDCHIRDSTYVTVSLFDNSLLPQSSTNP